MTMNTNKALTSYMTRREVLKRAEVIYERMHKQNVKEYELIVQKLPDSAPKNISAYIRMKKAYSKRFRSLFEEAAKAGITIHFM